MDDADYEVVKTFLLSAAMRLSPTGKEQAAFGKIVNEAEKDWAGDDDQNKRVLLALLGAMLDGLRFGNWPYDPEYKLQN